MTDESYLVKSDEDNLISNKLEIRIVESNMGIQSNEYSIYSQPKDALDELNSYDIESITSLIQKANLMFNFHTFHLK